MVPPVPKPKVAVGLWLWKHHRQARPGFALLSPFPSNEARGLPSSSTSLLRRGMVGVKLGEGWKNPMACGLLCSKHPAAAFSDHFLPSFTARSKTSSLFAKCHPPRRALAFQGRRDAEGRGRWGHTVCSRQWDGSIPDWMLARLPPASPSLEDLFCHLCAGASSATLHTTGQGPPGKGNCKKALRGSRRGAERDSSPFSFTLSFLKGHAKLSRKGNIRTERSVHRRLAGVLPRTGSFRVTDGGK